MIPDVAKMTSLPKPLNLKHVNTTPGVYFLLKNERVLYIGSTTNLRARLGHHLASKPELHDDEYGIRVFECSRSEYRKIERDAIFHYQPIFNSTHRGKNWMGEVDEQRDPFFAQWSPDLGSDIRDRLIPRSNALGAVLKGWRHFHYISAKRAARVIGISTEAFNNLEGHKGRDCTEQEREIFLRWLLAS